MQYEWFVGFHNTTMFQLGSSALFSCNDGNKIYIASQKKNYKVKKNWKNYL